MSRKVERILADTFFLIHFLREIRHKPSFVEQLFNFNSNFFVCAKFSNFHILTSRNEIKNFYSFDVALPVDK